MAAGGEAGEIASTSIGNTPGLPLADASALCTEDVPARSQGLYEWNDMEDRLLIRLRETYGPAWEKIARFFPGISEEVIQHRWNNTGPRRKKVAWTPEDDTLLVRARAAIGANWKEIGELFPGRNAESCRKHFASIKAGASSDNADGVFPREKRKRKGKGFIEHVAMEGLLQADGADCASAGPFFAELLEAGPLQKQVELVSEIVPSWQQQDESLHVQSGFAQQAKLSWQPLPAPSEEQQDLRNHV